MSFANPRKLIIEIMEGIGFELEKDAFDFDNVGNSKLDDGFHVEQGEISGAGVHQQANSISQLQTVRYWEKDKKNTSDGMIDALETLDKVMNNLLDINNRTNGVVNILFNSFNAVPISNDNDKIIRGELSLTVTQELCFSASN